MKTIIVVRHPEKTGDAITAYGAQQAFTAALALGALYPKITQLLWSGANRAWQALLVTWAAIGRDDGGWFKENRGFHFEPTLTNTVKDSAGFNAEVAEMKQMLGKTALTVADALKHSEYARLGQEVMTNTLLELASRMKDGDVALAISHSPWLELAAVDPVTMPYGIGEADAIVYKVEGGKVFASDLVKAPLVGKANC